MRDFLWGAATSSHQIEGNNEHNDWWAWEKAGNIEGGARSGRACDHWQRWKEDIRLAADLGLSSYRFSVEWSRLEPEQGVWNKEALDWYEALVDECRLQRIVPMLTLHHFTLPAWAAQMGAYCWPGLPKAFLNYTKRVQKRLGSKVPLWCTLNEPMVLVCGAYLARFMPPAVYSPRKAWHAAQNLMMMHQLAYRHLRSHLPPSAQVGIALNLLDFCPDRSWHPSDRALAWGAEKIYNTAWVEALAGQTPFFKWPWRLWSRRVREEFLTKATTDFFGVNYYTKAYMRWLPRTATPHVHESTRLGLNFARRTEAQSDMGWALHPGGLGKLLRWAGRFGKPLYVTENGIADQDDSRRPRYLREHLQEVAKAIEDGVDVRGYYHWSLLDNFEWIKGFGPRFGLYKMDYDTMERSPTQSAVLYREIIRKHRGLAPDSTLLADAHGA